MGLLEDQVRQNTLTLQAIADNAQKIKDLALLGIGLDGTEAIAIQLAGGDTLHTTIAQIASFLGVLGGLQDIFGGAGVSIDKTDPLNPIITVSAKSVVEITIDGKLFHLWKNPDNNNPLNVDVLEENDIIKGFDSAGRYMEAVYLGGDDTLFNDLAVYNRFAGTTL